MIPDILVRLAALASLASAAANTADPDFAPLLGAQLLPGATFPSQSPVPGSASLPNQLLVYAWTNLSKTLSANTTAPQFESVITLVVEARVETKTPAPVTTLPAQPMGNEVSVAVDGALAQLAYAVKKAVCQYIQGAARLLNDGTLGVQADMPVIGEIREVEIASRLDDSGQRIAGNAGVRFELCFNETFEPLIPNALDEIVILVNPQAGGRANSGNTGNGAIGAVTVGIGAEPGVYALAFTSATQFTVTAPDGVSTAPGALGTPFAALGLGFTLTAGSHAFIAGDGFAITVQVAAEDLITFT